MSSQFSQYFNSDLINDPIASRTDWSPLTRDLASFATKVLATAGTNRIEFRPSITTKAIFFIAAFAMPGIHLAQYLLFGSLSLASLVTDAIIAGVVFYIFRSHLKKAVFDREKGYLTGSALGLSGYSVPLSDIHALQLLAKYRRPRPSDRRSYHTYELNLVLRDASRFNVMSHGDARRMHTDAGTLGTFLNVPLWDGTGGLSG